MANFVPFRKDAVDKVTGAARYGADYVFPGMLYAKILWAPVVSGKILKIDTSLAEKEPGVVRIITREDIHGLNLHGMLGDYDHPVLLGEGDTIKYQGDALALVAAESAGEAEHALDKILVEYEEYPAAHSVEDAKAMGHEPTIVKSTQKGDIDAGFAKAAVVVEEKYRLPYNEHAFIEPEGGVAYFDDHGVIVVCLGTQDVAANHRAICVSLGYQHNMVRMHSPYVGGGFGGKHSISVQIFLALLAGVTHRPVKLEWTREESMKVGSKKQETFGVVRLGLDKEGKICALQARAEGPNAPYTGNGPDNFGGAINGMIGPYRLPNIDLKGNMYATTGPELGAFRGVGAPDGVFVFESMLTRAGKALGLSQLEVRERNWIRENDEFLTLTNNCYIRNRSPKWAMPEVVERALEKAGPLPEAKPGKKVGRGIACAKPAFALGNTPYHSGSTAEILMFFDGSISVKSGFCELGQGITAIASRIAADTLDIPEEKVDVILGDSHFTPKAGALGFSQGTVNLGNAVIDASLKMKRLVEEKAGACLHRDPDEIDFHSGEFYSKDGEKLLTWEAFSRHCFAEVEHLATTGRWVGTEEEKIIYSVTPIAGVCDVEVDEETGETRILQVVHCHDIGKVFNYPGARGQIVGGAVMALGGTTMEEYLMKDGHTVTPSFAEYLIPTAKDVPEKNEVVFYEENPAETCPQGAKAIGEHGMYVVGAAFSNALYEACGITILDIPITPEKILKALGKI